MYLKLTAADVKNASMITLSCAIAVFLSKWLDLITGAETHLQAITKLDQDLKNIEQGLKDFRYEPISFLFKRYHLSVLLIPLIRNFLTSLKKTPCYRL